MKRLAGAPWIAFAAAMRLAAPRADAQEPHLYAPPAGQPPAAQPQPDPWGGMSSGGVAPPPPLDQAAQPPPNQPPAGAPPPLVSDELDESKESDSGRGLSWFWIEAQGGYEHAGLQTFNVDEEEFNAGFVETVSNGGVLSAGLGAQLVFVTLGVRGRMGFFPDWQIGRIGGEIGFKIPIGIVEPRFDIGAGYAALANFDGVVPEQIAVRGFYARAGAGVDFYPVEILAIGAVASFDFMGLTRPGLTPAELAELERSNPDLDESQETALAADGSGYGSTFAIQGNIGLHF